MNITVYSRNRLYETFSKWDVPRDFADPMANYLVYGYEPGGCFTSVLANDFFAAMQRPAFAQASTKSPTCSTNLPSANAIGTRASTPISPTPQALRSETPSDLATVNG